MLFDQVYEAGVELALAQIGAHLFSRPVDRIGGDRSGERMCMIIRMQRAIRGDQCRRRERQASLAIGIRARNERAHRAFVLCAAERPVVTIVCLVARLRRDVRGRQQ